MALTLNEENIFKKQIEVQKLEQQLQNLILTKPVLTSTKDVEISILKQQIKAEEIHIKRTEYVKKVQPMKDNYRILIAQNKQIEIDNKIAIDIAQNVDKLAKQVILDNINVVKNELDILLGKV